MRFRDTRTGATYEPGTEFAAAQMAKNPALAPVCDAEGRPRPVRRRTAKKAEKAEE